MSSDQRMSREGRACRGRGCAGCASSAAPERRARCARRRRPAATPSAHLVEQHQVVDLLLHLTLAPFLCAGRGGGGADRTSATRRRCNMPAGARRETKACGHSHSAPESAPWPHAHLLLALAAVGSSNGLGLLTLLLLGCLQVSRTVRWRDESAAPALCHSLCGRAVQCA